MPTAGTTTCSRCHRRKPKGAHCPTCTQRAGGLVAYRNDGGQQAFRKGVIGNNPDEPEYWCVLCAEEGKATRATEADHYPLSKRELRRRHLDENDPRYGRPLCVDHHRANTPRGGWGKTNDER